MKRYLIGITLLVLVSTQLEVDPPMWAEVFSQAFVESYQTTSLYITGKLHYDSKKGFERIDRSDGRY